MTIKIKISYLATIIFSLLLLLIGHKIAVSGMSGIPVFSQEHARASVRTIIDRVQPGDDMELFDDEFDDFFISMLGEKIVFQAIITGGIRKGQIVTAEQSLSGFLLSTPREVREGDSVLLIRNEAGWFWNGFFRSNKMLVLGIVFVLCVLLLGGKKGFNTIISLALTCSAVFAVFIPSILSGKNIYLMAALVCVYTTIMTLLIVIGYNKKSLAAALGCIGGIVIAGIIAIIMDRVLPLTGFVDEHSRHLINLPLDTQVSLRAIIFAGIIIGAMGAIMDVAMSISSSLWELKEKARVIKFETLYRSGLNIGRDIMGSMANTLILAYIGSSLSVVLLLSVYSNSLVELLNMEMILVEILQALAGSFGILLAIPLTAFFCSTLYLKE